MRHILCSFMPVGSESEMKGRSFCSNYLLIISFYIIFAVTSEKSGVNGVSRQMPDIL